MGIRKITEEEASKIIETRQPIGLFYIKASNALGKKFIGIDNSTGDAWTEEFRKLRLCKAWLRREMEIE